MEPSWSLESHLIASIGTKARTPIHPDHGHLDLLTVHANDDVVMGIRSRFDTGLDEMVEGDMARVVRLEKGAKAGVARGPRGRRATTPRPDQVQAVLTACVPVALHPVFEQVLV